MAQCGSIRGEGALLTTSSGPSRTLLSPPAPGGRRSPSGREETLPHTNNDPVSRLQQLGVEVYDKEDNANIGWDSLAGYDNVKKFLEETIINSLKFPDIYDEITRNTRVNFESNRPKAVLLEGPPGMKHQNPHLN